MKTPASVNQLLQKPMNRKEFLQHSAAIAVFLAGGGMIAQSLLKGFGVGQAERSVSATGYGYGASLYGGAVSTNTKR